MFKVGDKVICIKTDKYRKIIPFVTILKISNLSQYSNVYFEKISNIVVENFAYNSYDFMLLSEYRKQKLNNLCSKSEID